MTGPEPPVLTVFFDGSCPLCQREIALYRRLPSLQPIEWWDVSRGPACAPGGLPPGNAFADAGLSCETAMQRFHVRTAQGQLLSGASAFSVLWRCFKGWRVLGWAIALPPMSWLAELAYRAFLLVRPRMQRWAQRRFVQS